MKGPLVPLRQTVAKLSDMLYLHASLLFSQGCSHLPYLLPPLWNSLTLPCLSNLIHASRPAPSHTYLPNPSSHQRKLFSLLTSQGTYLLYQLVPKICHLIICSINSSANKCLCLCPDCKFLEER